MEYDLALVRETVVFKGITAFEAKQVFECCAAVREFAPGEIIIEEGSLNDDLYFLPQGKVRVELELSRVKHKQISSIEGPIVLGEISFLDKSPRSATIRSGAELEIYVINGKALDELLGEMPHTGHKIKHNIALSVAKTVRSMNELLSFEMQKNRMLQNKASEMGAQRYNSAMANLSSQVHLSA